MWFQRILMTLLPIIITVKSYVINLNEEKLYKVEKFPEIGNIFNKTRGYFQQDRILLTPKNRKDISHNISVPNFLDPQKLIIEDSKNLPIALSSKNPKIDDSISFSEISDSKNPKIHDSERYSVSSGSKNSEIQNSRTLSATSNFQNPKIEESLSFSTTLNIPNPKTDDILSFPKSQYSENLKIDDLRSFSKNSDTQNQNFQLEFNETIVKIDPQDKLGAPNLKSTNNQVCKWDKNDLVEIEKYREKVNEIIKSTVHGEFKGKAFEVLSEMTDNFGARMTCSSPLEKSINWILKKSKDEKLENIHNEYFKAPHWVRNNESLYLLHPRRQEMRILSLGSSVGTPAGGITAEVIVVKSFEELEKVKHKAMGKIVLFNPTWTSYGQMVKYRVKGASFASRAGALASLVGSVTPFSINTPHTGWQEYERSVTKIPTASVTPEDAQMMQRIQDRGDKIMVHLKMGARNLPDCTTRNTILELKGREKPEDVVVVSGHLDSWDVGVGAMDDGGGSIVSWMVPVVLRNLDLRPRRTIRTILFSGEEQGLHGGKNYFDRHSKKKDNFQLLLESDIGTFNPLGLSFSGNERAVCIIAKILSLLESLNTTEIATPMTGGPDISFWEKAGVPTGSILNANDKYFWFHHSEGDRISVEDSATLDRCVALWTAVAYVAADMNITLPR